jgi:hypothetical protein
MAFVFESKRNCIVNKSLIRMSNVFILNNSFLAIYGFVFEAKRNLLLITLVSLVFSFSVVYQWIRLTSLFILIVFWVESPKIFYFERFKAQFNPSVRTNLTVLKNVAY